MKLALCDDSPRDMARLVGLLKAYGEKRRLPLSYDVFSNALNLLDAMERQTYDLVILDIIMPSFSGMEAAHAIRKANDPVKIVFLTVSPEYAVESYRVQASDYLLKPITQDVLFPLLDRLFQHRQEPPQALTLRSHGSVLRVPYDDIVYIEILDKILYFHLRDSHVRQLPGSLMEYAPTLLQQPGFHKIHRSFLVNFRWVTQLRPGELLTAFGDVIPVARSVYIQTRNAYTEYLLQTNGAPGR